METAEMHVLLEVSRFLAQAFVSGLWQGMVLISAAAICLRLLPRVSPSVRFAIWGLAFALTVTIPLLHLEMLAARGANTSSAMLHLGAACGFAIAGVWAVLVVARLAQISVQAVRLRRIWKRAVPVVAEGAVFELLRNGGRAAELCRSADVDSPCVIGFFAPRLLVPEWLSAELSEPELRHIVLHECEHLRRHDDWMNLVQKVGLALFPLNPALFWADRQLSLERELACDAGVVAVTSAPFDYAHSLTRLAEQRRRYRGVALALSAWSRQSELARRVHNLLRPMSAMSPMYAGVFVALLSVGLAGGGAVMARMPGFVSFTDAVSAPVAEVDGTAVSAPATQAVPVVFRPAVQPHIVLLKATLPHRTPRSKAAREVSRAQPMRISPQPRVVMTTAMQTTAQRTEDFDREEATPVYAVPAEFSPSYAAVPFGDGWLIIQL